MSSKHFLCLCVCSQNMCIYIYIFFFLMKRSYSAFQKFISQTPSTWIFHTVLFYGCMCGMFSVAPSALLYLFILPGPRDWLEWPTPVGSPALWDHPVGTSSMTSVRGRQTKQGFFFFFTTTSLWGHWGVDESPTQVTVTSTQLPLSGSSYIPSRASLVTQMVKNLPAIQETQVQSLDQEDPLERGMATQSSVLTWRIPWTEEPGRLQFMGSYKLNSTGRPTL